MKNSVKIIILGSVLLIGGIIGGVGGTMLQMIETFNTVDQSGVNSASELANNVSDSLYSTAIGLSVALIGFMFCVGGSIAYFTSKKESKQSEPSAPQT
jgi:uncharacterized membrane protein